MRDVCLLGGGHSHVLLIRNWAMNPLPGVRLTLISSASTTPYSGMLPGLISGHYSVDDIHIDLRQLSVWAGVRFIENTAVGLMLDAKQVLLADRPAVAFDVLSLDTGSTADLSVPGARAYATPVKPVHDFHERWLAVLGQVRDNKKGPISIGVIGSGAGGFELVTAMRYALPVEKARCFWFLREKTALNGRPKKVGQLALEAARRSGVEVITHCDVAAVDEAGLTATDGRAFPLDEILWCTGVVGPSWAAAAGMAVDERGFVLTNACLQSVSHPFVFASGDIGTQRDTPSDKAGVFAVRQAPVLSKNIRHYILGELLDDFRPQADFLSLMATGGKRAIASRGVFAFEADWLWRWKDQIDRTFMNKFKRLEPLQMNAGLNVLHNALRDSQDEAANSMQCRGCGSKVGGSILDRVLGSISTVQRDDVVCGLSLAADTAVIQLPANAAIAQSVDHINSIVDDPYVLGRIAALHALSDVVTLDTLPQSAQVIVSVPAASNTIKERDLFQLMSGLVDALNEEECTLIGGHTIEGKEMSIGVVVNALLVPAVAQRTLLSDKSNERPSTTLAIINAGDRLVLTQPLGTGALFAAVMQQSTLAGSAVGVDTAIQAMQTSNRPAATVLRQCGATAMTDVTGFGLLGHLQRLMQHTAQGATINSTKVPLFGGALSVAQKGIRSSLWPQNKLALVSMNIGPDVQEAMLSLLCDPQTGGGLLAVLPQSRCDEAVTKLRQSGYGLAADVGFVDDTGFVTVQ